MSKYVRTYMCWDCGQECRRKRGTGQPLLCADCQTERMIEAARQMANKAGPFYDAWEQTRGPQGRPRIDRK